MAFGLGGSQRSFPGKLVGCWQSNFFTRVKLALDKLIALVYKLTILA